MKKTKFTEEQIAFALRQAETGTRVVEVCRKLGISDATLYTWRKKYGGLGVPELRRLKQLEEENRKLKQLVADNLFNGRRIRALTVVDNFTRECLTTDWFLSLDDAKEKIETWRMEYNQYRPHSSLNDLSPGAFYQQHQKAGNLEFTGVWFRGEAQNLNKHHWTK